MAINLENFENLALDEEPKLKYSRLSNDVQNIFLKDAVSCIKVHTKFICLGTQWGIIHLLDHEGNTVPITTNNGGKEKELRAHSIAVNWISVDDNGDYIASCSDDGKVLIHGLYSTENNHGFTVVRAVKSIALDPNYHKAGSGRRFVTGDHKLTLYEKTFLNRLRATVISECDGYVQMIAWKGRFVAWASEMGVRVYDITAKVSLGLIQWETAETKQLDEFRCNLLWANNKTLMIGWVDTVRICVIRKRSSLELATRDVTEFLVDPVYTFQADYYICGLGPLYDQLVILGVPKDKDSTTGKSQRPFLAIADYKNCEFNELSNDSLNIRGYEEYSCKDYHLDVLLEENRFFIVAPKDIVISKPYDTDDKVNWLMEHGKYEKAIQVLEESGEKSSKHSVETIGLHFLDHMLSESKYDAAAVLCSKICKSDKFLWEAQLQKFSDHCQLRSVCKYLPTSKEFRLSCQIYEMTLFEILKTDSQAFLNLIREWDPSLYRTSFVINAVMELLLRNTVDKNTNLEALATLYTYEGKYDKALTMYLKLSHKDVFELIKKYDMYNSIHDKILDLMTLDCDKAIAMLLDKTKVPLQVVQEQLEENDFYLYKYLDAFSKVHPNSRDNGNLVKLYAKYAREKLLPFLESNDKYPIQEALDICTAKQFHKEMVFLLGRIDKTKEALQLILDKLDDINYAIIFCQEHNDKELWMYLIDKTVDKPQHVNLLLKRIANYVDPGILIQGLKASSKVGELKDSLTKMISDYNLQLSVQEACKDITLRDYFELHEKLVKGQQHGVLVGDEFICSLCQGVIIMKDLSKCSDIIIYNCKHSFHVECFRAKHYNDQNCVVCYAAKT